MEVEGRIGLKKKRVITTREKPGRDGNFIGMERIAGTKLKNQRRL